MSGLVERSGEFRRIAEARRAAAAGAGVTVLVEGVAGVGKTALLDHAAASAAADGDEVARATGHPLEAALSFGVVRQLLEPLVARLSADRRAALASGEGRRAMALLTGGTADETGDLELVHATYRLVEHLAAEGPLLLVVDDAQWADRASVRLLVYLSQRLEQQPVSMVLGVRTGEPSEVSDLLTRVPVEPTPVSPLSPEATAVLVRRRFPDADEVVCAECHRVTGGNPLLITELLSGLEGTDGAVDHERIKDLWKVTTMSLLRTTAHRLTGVGSDALEVARAVAVLGPGATLLRVAHLSGLPVERCVSGLDVLSAAGVLTGGDPPAFVHPLVEGAVGTDIPEAQRALRHRRAAELGWADLDDAEQVSAHLLQATRQGDPAAVRTLRAAARLARSRGAADSACRYLERALAEPPAPADRVEVLTELADAELMAGSAATWVHLDEAVRVADDPAVRSRLLLRTGDLLFHAGRYDDAAAAFERARNEQSGPDVEARVRGSQLAVEALRPGAVVHVEPQLAVPDDALPSQLVHLALLSVVGVGDHRATRDLVRRAMDAGLEKEGVGLDLLIALSCMAWSDMFEECEAVIDRALSSSERDAAHLAGAHLRFGRAWIRYWGGRLDEAVADSLWAIEPWRGGWNGQVDAARFWCAASLVELDRLDQARDVLDEADLGPHRIDPVGRATHHVGRGRIAVARGDLATAHDELLLAANLAADLPFLHSPAALEWRSETALVCHATGDDARARELVEEELDLARRFGAPRALGVALRGHGLVVGGAAGLEELRESVAVLGRSPARLEEVRAQVDLGAALRRAGHRTEARDLLREAQAAALALGAVRLRDRARVELVSAGGRPRRDAVRGPDALTPSERRVATMAAAGRSNPDIAAELYISRRTVEFHLRGAFRKLEVASRGELAEALRRTG